MIELNLLPDVKMEYIKAQRTRRLMFSISVIATVAAVVILGLLLGVNGLQKKHLNDLSSDIASESSKLKSQKNIAKVLTVQNQLESLTSLHSGKPAASNLFTFLNQVTPNQISISKINIDFTQQTATISGGTNALSSVNQYIDTLKYTTYGAKDEDGNIVTGKAFNNVVMSSYSVSSTTKDTSKAATFAINLAYDKTIFDITKEVKLKVPSSTSTRALTENPTALFQEQSSPTTPGGN